MPRHEQSRAIIDVDAVAIIEVDSDETTDESSSDEIIYVDDDVAYNHATILPDHINAVLPPCPEGSVASLLLHKSLPPLLSDKVPHKPPKDCITHLPPNVSEERLHQCAIPLGAWLGPLDLALQERIRLEHRPTSLLHPSDTNLRFPLWGIRFWWTWLWVIEQRKLWTTADGWLTTCEDSVEVREAKELMKNLPWEMRFMIGKHEAPIGLLAEFISRAWLRERHFELFASYAESLAKASAQQVWIGEPWFVKLVSMDKAQAPRRLDKAGKAQQLDNAGKSQGQLKSRKRSKPGDLENLHKTFKQEKYKRLLFPANVGGNHWIACSVNVEQGLLHIGVPYLLPLGEEMYWTYHPRYDSGDSIYGLPVVGDTKQVCDNITAWLALAFKRKFSISTQALPIGRQKDGHSCGIFVMNAIEHAIRNVPLLTPEGWRGWRVSYFLTLTRYVLERVRQPSVHLHGRNCTHIVVSHLQGGTRSDPRRAGSSSISRLTMDATNHPSLPSPHSAGLQKLVPVIPTNANPIMVENEVERLPPSPSFKQPWILYDYVNPTPKHPAMDGGYPTSQWTTIAASNSDGDLVADKVKVDSHLYDHMLLYPNVHLHIFTVFRQLFQIDLEDEPNRPLFGYDENTVCNLTVYQVVCGKDAPTDPREVTEPSRRSLLPNPNKFKVHPGYHRVILGFKREIAVVLQDRKHDAHHLFRAMYLLQVLDHFAEELADEKRAITMRWRSRVLNPLLQRQLRGIHDHSIPLIKEVVGLTKQDAARFYLVMDPFDPKLEKRVLRSLLYIWQVRWSIGRCIEGRYSKATVEDCERSRAITEKLWTERSTLDETEFESTPLWNYEGQAIVEEDIVQYYADCMEEAVSGVCFH